MADAFASWRAAVITFQLLARRRLKKRFNYFGASRIWMNRARRAKKLDPTHEKSQRATEMRRSVSGAAVRLTPGGEMGRALGWIWGRANSAIPRGTAVLGKGDALAARGGRAEDELPRMGRWCGCAFATRRVAQFAATPRGGLQLVGARCIHRWRQTVVAPSTNEASAPQRVARAGRLPSGGPQHAAPRRELSYLPGVRPTNVKQK